MLYKGRVQYCIHLTEKKDRSQEILEVLETGPKGFNEIHLKLSGNHTSLRANLTRLMDRGQIIQNDSNKKYEKNEEYHSLPIEHTFRKQEFQKAQLHRCIVQIKKIKPLFKIHEDTQEPEKETEITLPNGAKALFRHSPSTFAYWMNPKARSHLRNYGILLDDIAGTLVALAIDDVLPKKYHRILKDSTLETLKESFEEFASLKEGDEYRKCLDNYLKWNTSTYKYWHSEQSLKKKLIIENKESARKQTSTKNS